MNMSGCLLILCASAVLLPTQVLAIQALAAPGPAACSSDSQKNTLCLCKLTVLHPTQISLGEFRVQELVREPDWKFLEHATKKPVKVLIGPAGVLYVTDGHHHARAMLDRLDHQQSQLDETMCLVIENDVRASFSSDAAFWDWMKKNQHARLEGGDLDGGKVLPGVFPPVSLRDMQNDEYRSLAGLLQDACKIDMNADYDQFRWADFLRSKKIRPPRPSDDPEEVGLAAGREIKKLAKKNPGIESEVRKLPGAAALANCKTP
jgi:hypothetical protein